jgi:hypothetical protein
MTTSMPKPRASAVVQPRARSPWTSGPTRPPSGPGTEAATPRSRRPVPVLAGIVVVAIGGLIGIVLLGGSQDRTAVLTVTRSVPAGATIDAGDLAAVDVAVPARVATVRADERDTLAGKVARVDLAAGSVLAPGNIGDPIDPQAGQSLVVLALPVSRMPASGLRPGQRLVLVSTTDAHASTTEVQVSADAEPADTAAQGAAAATATADAVVIKVGTADPGGTTPVDVAVHVGDGPLWAGLAATGQVTLLVEPQRQAQR